MTIGFKVNGNGEKSVADGVVTRSSENSKNLKFISGLVTIEVITTDYTVYQNDVLSRKINKNYTILI